MKAKIKIHSAFKSLFSESEYSADLQSYADILLYLGSLHPKFKSYASAIHENRCQEGYALLDSNLRLISDQDLYIKKVKENDEFYLVPGIVGGGGKRTGKLVQFAVIAAAAYFGGTAIAGALSGGGSAAVSGAAAQSAAGAGTGGFFGISASTLAINAGLALVTMLFTKRPEIQQGGKDQQIRQNSMFGGLQNTIESGTPIPLIYGQHRMTGQLISGYLDTVDHGKDDNITVSSRFTS